ncbi:MAG TPA: peroxiredoxin [Candidatus Limnocylindrales bacterium]|nr:peroxiredoxin [Candidatus Limnocylindrales bacterium]
MTAETAVPAVGQEAPPVILADETGRVHDLAEQRGRWTVLYFYPKDDTPGCNTEACQFRDLNLDYAATDADVWGVSKDSAASHQRFREKFDLPFVLLTDPQREVIDRYGAWGEKTAMGRTYMGIIRSTFLIDPDGRIARTWPKVKADGHAAEVLQALGEERAARAAG